ncbi:hypothetical protein C1886_10345 [Pseudomonas sp. FW300-N1A1]|uniref:hypothetical protein n=1 Tax=Pseudomonas sp. FW300-N1A1 TaxID=2075555 RepID=UPI000CD1808A|nr:hypothetical protein [Pseudomonas sp. FW300-N1A1]POA20071.1 hypothetical protein C1886_10345 [Pseudomonas sp. FW300-N1A1]
MIDSIPQAAVVGGSIVAFAGDLPESHREDIYLSTMYAQRATRDAVRDGLSGDWFDFYRNTLKYIGWDVPAPETLSAVRDDVMGELALQRISARMGEMFSSPLRRALVALEKNALALKLFESTSLSQDAGCFQMIPCSLKGPNKVEMGLYHRQFTIRQSVSRFLFVDSVKQVHSSTEQMSVITFNTLYYAQFREKVKKAVLSQSMEYLRSLEI